MTRLACLVLVMSALAACSEATLESEPDVPRLLAMDKQAYMVGEQMLFEGENLLIGEEGETWIRFDGTFIGDDGTIQEATFDAPTVVVADQSDGETQKVIWQRFGPYSNPFTNQGESGEFVGRIIPINRYADGREEIGTSEVKKLRVEPSLEIIELQPAWADCGLPALSGFGGTPYRLRVRAMGFTPESFDYRISGLIDPDAEGPTYTGDFTEFHQEATGHIATLDEDDGLIFVPPPIDTRYYIANIQVRAKDRTTGRYVETYLPFEIRRPIEISYDGKYEVAQIYEPQPVSACIPGAIGNRATYSETETDVRQQSVSVSIANQFVEEHGISTSENWTEGYGTTDSLSTTKTDSESTSTTGSSSLTSAQSHSSSSSNSFNFGTTDAENWQTGNKAGGTVGGEGSVGIPLVANGKVRAEARYDRSWGNGGSNSESRNWGSSWSAGSSQTVAGTYTLSDTVSSTTSKSDTESRSESRTYNFGASASESQRISEGMTEAEASTWTESNSHSTLTSYSGFIPVGKFGVFYRQTIRMVRRARITAYDACGNSEPMGEILMNEWNWAPELAVGDDCQGELPPSGLPQAQCVIKPCD